MKITYVAYARMPTEKAHGIQIASMCSALVKAGNEVRLLVPEWPNHLRESVFEYYGIPKNFTIEYVSAPHIPGAIGYVLREILFAWSVRRCAAKAHSDVILTRSPWVTWALGKKYKAVYEVHDIPERLRFLWEYLIRSASGYISTNRFKAEELQKALKIAPERMLVAPNGYDAELFTGTPDKEQLRRELELPLGKHIALYTGNMYGWKGVEMLAEAAKSLPEITFVFVGGTDLDVVRFREVHRDTENITLIPHQHHHNIPRYLKAADVLVLPNSAFSVESRLYTSPIKLFEYLASGTPVVASDLPSIREIVSEKEVQFVPPDDVVALAGAVNKVCMNKEEANTRALRARELSLSYTWERRAHNIAGFVGAVSKL